ncbi:hypothetical protein CCR75_000955 [Bremia lactucae]|uniref:Uncharacterized protein n=1 Tax=Bremia lactucae TaxID=4779 RepID=A0A976FKR7_BRELC|nr:hypothetical protein CCR75_000955 [Bremia lactucae]
MRFLAFYGCANTPCKLTGHHAISVHQQRHIGNQKVPALEEQVLNGTASRPAVEGADCMCLRMNTELVEFKDASVVVDDKVMSWHFSLINEHTDILRLTKKHYATGQASIRGEWLRSGIACSQFAESSTTTSSRSSPSHRF